MKKYVLGIGCLLLACGLIYLMSGLQFSPRSSQTELDAMSQNVQALAVQETASLPDLSKVEKTAEKSHHGKHETKTSTEKTSEKESDGIDLVKEQKKILKKKDKKFSNTKLTKRLRSCILVGDSIAYGGFEYGWLTEASYSAKIGISIHTGMEQIDAAIAAAPEVMFLSFGVNDIEAYGSHVKRFIKDYRKVINKVKKETPSTKIYVCALFCPEDWVAEENSYYQYLDRYNEKLERLCEKKNVKYVDCNFLLENMPELYDADGIHPVSKFYPLWFTYLADVAGLPKK